MCTQYVAIGPPGYCLALLPGGTDLGRAKAAPCRLYPNLGVMLGTVDRAGLAGLRGDPGVQSVAGAPAISPIWPRSVKAAKLTQANTWGIERLGIPALWSQGLSGAGVLVGHLDTGADGKHPALRKAIAHFAEFDEMGRRRAPDPKAWDSDDHGTHTAATIAGRAVGGRAVGVAPGASLASAMVIEGGDAVARVLGGMDWALGQGGPSRPTRLIEALHRLAEQGAVPGKSGPPGERKRFSPRPVASPALLPGLGRFRSAQGVALTLAPQLQRLELDLDRDRDGVWDAKPIRRGRRSPLRACGCRRSGRPRR